MREVTGFVGVTGITVVTVVFFAQEYSIKNEVIMNINEKILFFIIEFLKFNKFYQFFSKFQNKINIHRKTH
jgi:hypothetical protein